MRYHRPDLTKSRPFMLPAPDILWRATIYHRSAALRMIFKFVQRWTYNFRSCVKNEERPCRCAHEDVFSRWFKAGHSHSRPLVVRLKVNHESCMAGRTVFCWADYQSPRRPESRKAQHASVDLFGGRRQMLHQCRSKLGLCCCSSEENETPFRVPRCSTFTCFVDEKML